MDVPFSNQEKPASKTANPTSPKEQSAPPVAQSQCKLPVLIGNIKIFLLEVVEIIEQHGAQIALLACAVHIEEATTLIELPAGL